MRISFDLDDTLVCGDHVPSESFVPRLLRPFYPERLRAGTGQLMTALSARGCSLWVYTSSRRHPRYIRRWFRAGGVRLDGVVTQCVHEEHIGSRGPSKFPPAFGIGLHVDDSMGVAMEGWSHGFQVLLVEPEERWWVEKVLREVDRLRAMRAEPRWRPTPAPGGIALPALHR